MIALAWLHRASAGCDRRVEAWSPAASEFPTDRDARDTERFSIAGIALYEHADRIVLRANQHDARRGADAALEAEPGHAGPAADTALLDRAGLGRIERSRCCLRRDMETFEIVEVPAPGLGNYRPSGFAKG